MKGLCFWSLVIFLYTTQGVYGVDDENLSHNKKYNRLIDEKSPYLLQHADNPVDWYPWGEEAFAKARNEDKPIFLSIGYSTCHWCHVMELESFEDTEVAKLMNDTFVSIKVDREERPDIDSVYMTVAQMMTGSGGWPLTIIMTPDKKPFFAGTYIPKNNYFNRIGMIPLTERVKTLWQTERKSLLESAETISAKLLTLSNSSAPESINEEILEKTFQKLSKTFDRKNGGFGNQQKFPTPHNLMFLMRYYKRTNNKEALNMVEQTLQTMQLGGIYDHIGFGFHRYSVDPEWRIPHFEKMLYDQALLAMVYTEAFQITKKSAYKKTAEEVFNYVLRDMMSGNGGFYSAEDADSEKEEGKFYLWSHKEMESLLNNDSLKLIKKAFSITKSGNFDDKSDSNILYLKQQPGDQFTIDTQATIKKTLRKLFEIREKRVHPHKDDKILTDWNGLMIASLAKASRVFGNDSYKKSAEKSARFILDNLRENEGRLLHMFKDNQANVKAYATDYAFFIWGLLELYQTTYDAFYLKHAVSLNEDMIKYYWDEKLGGFYFTAHDAETLLVRKKEKYDGAVPSGNSVAMMNLVKLARITGNPSLEEMAHQIFSREVALYPSAHTFMMSAVDYIIGPAFEIIVTGNPESEDTEAILKPLREQFLPNIVVISTHDKSILDVAPYLKKYNGIDGKPTAYICFNNTCYLPTTNIHDVINFIEKENN